MEGINEAGSPFTSPGPEGFKQENPTLARPPYLAEDPWTSSTPPTDTSHWTRVREMLTKFDAGTIDSWKEEINTQLLVSSILSALTGAFVIETQKSLSEDPIVTSALLLSHVAMQLNTSSVLQTTLQPFSTPPPNVRAINSLLYVSLGLSLSNVTLGLLCLQWLRELKSDTPGIPDREYPRIRHMRHDGFQRWRAKDIVSTLPLLLLASLTCFFGGLLLHVSTIDWVVLIPVCVVLGFTFSILVSTTLLPAIVIARCAAIHPVELAGSYPPIPPFHSLQAWIVLRLIVATLRSSIFKKVNTYRRTLRTLARCPDWAHVNFFWYTKNRSGVDESFFLPLILSTDKPSKMDDVTACLYDIFPLARNTNATGLKIQTLRHFIRTYNNRLPPSARRRLISQLLTQLVHYFNDGADLSDIGHMEFESDLDFKANPTLHEIPKQLLHAIAGSYERDLPKHISSWNFLWNTLQFHVSTAHFWHSSPPLITQVLNVVEKGTHRHAIEAMVLLRRYNHFVSNLCRLLSSYRPFTSTNHGKRVAAAILFHPVWNKLASAARALPPTPRLDRLRNHLDTLDDLKSKHNLRNYAPIRVNLPTQSQLNPIQPHIFIDMEPSGSQSTSFDGENENPPFVTVAMDGEMAGGTKGRDSEAPRDEGAPRPIEMISTPGVLARHPIFVQTSVDLTGDE